MRGINICAGLHGSLFASILKHPEKFQEVIDVRKCYNGVRIRTKGFTIFAAV